MHLQRNQAEQRCLTTGQHRQALIVGQQQEGALNADQFNAGLRSSNRQRPAGLEAAGVPRNHNGRCVRIVIHVDFSFAHTGIDPEFAIGTEVDTGGCKAGHGEVGGGGDREAAQTQLDLAVEAGHSKGTEVEFGVYWNHRAVGGDLNAEATGDVPGIHQTQYSLAHDGHVGGRRIVRLAVEIGGSGRHDVELSRGI